jgi:2Fe-2S ferredoxin
MLELTVTDRDGAEHLIASQCGYKLMEALRDSDFGILAICGGACSCGTCHVRANQRAGPRCLSAPAEDANRTRDSVR